MPKLLTGQIEGTVTVKIRRDEVAREHIGGGAIRPDNVFEDKTDPSLANNWTANPMPG